MADHLDPELVIATFPENEREVVRAWLDTWGLESSAWSHLPSFVKVLELVAVMRTAADVPLDGAGDRIRSASEALGLVDDPGRSTHPGDRFIRRLTDWQNRAREADGEFLQPRSTDTG